MEVILLETIGKLGAVGDVVTVKNGYARNFLIPQHKALRATNDNKATFEAKRAEVEAKDAERQKQAEAASKVLNDKFYVLIRQAGEDGRLYGSVAARDIAELIAASGDVEISRNQVVLDTPIKYLNVYKVPVSLHPAVEAHVLVNVARSADEAEDAKKEFLNPTKKKDEEAIEPVEAKAEEVAEEATTEEAPEAEAAEEK